MPTNLRQLETKIRELEQLAEEVVFLAEKLSKGDASVQPELSIKGQRWYRAARALLVGAGFSGLEGFDICYDSSIGRERGRGSFTDIEQYLERGNNPSSRQLWSSEAQGAEYFGLFSQYFRKARTLLLSVVDELLARELPVKTQLSFAVAATEFETAQEILAEANGTEVFVRAAGVIARIALERHLLTVLETRSIAVQLNPPTKRKQDTADILTTLQKSSVITPIQRSELEALFKVGNNCAHPKEAVVEQDVERLVRRGRELASIIL